MKNPFKQGRTIYEISVDHKFGPKLRSYIAEREWSDSSHISVFSEYKLYSICLEDLLDECAECMSSMAHWYKDSNHIDESWINEADRLTELLTNKGTA